MQEEDTGWTEARLIFGRLIGISKKQTELTLEYKDGDQWTQESFSLEDWTDEDYEDLLAKMGSDITVRVVDHTAIDWEE